VATLTGRYEGLVKLLGGEKLNLCGYGGSIRSRFNPSVTITLR